ncbi:TonB-dependent receptor [Ideonella margarita]|uniref:TonB-dependent receptor n=1 Tax=Ideonella margarita TaxID=2984191 RepID=A0ABU9C228_9BURK
MNISIKKQKGAFALSPVGAACAVLLVASVNVMAQEAQTVTVTGIRKGIEDAISVKKNSDQIVEAVSAEDIGKLPDTSIAESLARLPGVSAQRTAGGRASAISIRGLSPDFSTATLNGREQVSTGDSRGVEFDQYPSELLSGAVVYKTPDAGLIGQGLAGTIDLRTVRPLDFSARTVAINARKQRLGVGTDVTGTGSRFSLSYIDQFADRTIGVALGFARLDETGGAIQDNGDWGGGTTTYNGQTVNVINGFKGYTRQTKQTRDGAMASFQFKPNKDLSSTVDIFYSKFDQNQKSYGIEMGLNDSWVANDSFRDRPGSLINATVNNGTVTTGTFNNVRAVVRNEALGNKDKTSSIGWNTKWQATEKLQLIADLSYSKAKRDAFNLESYAGTATNGPGTTPLVGNITYTQGSFKLDSSLNYADRSIVKLTDVQGWSCCGDEQPGYSKLPTIRDDIKAARLDGKYALPEGGIFSDLSVGLNLSDRQKTKDTLEGYLWLKGTNGALYQNGEMPGSGVGIAGGTGLQIATFDVLAALGSVFEVGGRSTPDIVNKSWQVKEKMTTAYAKLDIDTTAGSLPLRGNIGVQMVGTDQSSTAFTTNRVLSGDDKLAGLPVSYTSGTTYTDVLPSMNLIGDLGNGYTMRLGLGKQMARPTMNDMRSARAVSIGSSGQDAGRFTGSGGTPDLKPFRATAIDVSFEKYFGNAAYVGVAAFHKDLSSYVVNYTNRAFDFKNFVSADYLAAAIAAGKVTDTIGTFTSPINGKGGSIDGVELSASLPLKQVAGFLDGFGIQASYSGTTSSISLPDTTGNNSGASMPLPGLSRDVYGLTVYYEKNGFSARVAGRERSDFVGEIADNFAQRQLTYIKGETVVDLQLGYEIQSGPAKGLGLLLQVNNLTDAKYVEYRGAYKKPTSINKEIKYGKTILAGVNYKF